MSFKNDKPHVNFEINKELDYWAVGEFLTFDPNDLISKNILDTHPNLKDALNLDSAEKTSFYKNYVDRMYAEKGEALIDTKKDLQKSWGLVEQEFLDETAKMAKRILYWVFIYFQLQPKVFRRKNFSNLLQTS